jgi:spermidine synthase
VYAASTVLAAFMGGLGIGSALAGYVLARVRRPLLVFGIAEILIGLSALATPLVLDAASNLYAAIYPATGGSLLVLTAARLLTGFVVLLVPTALMGMTLPVLSASAVVRHGALGSHISALYAVNTAGAVTGAVVTGFYLIGAIGIQRSFVLGAAVNVLVGVGALVLARRGGDALEIATDAAPAANATVMTSAAPKAIGAVVLLSGLVSLALEIVWFRMLVQYLAATTYAFTAMLAMVLIGIAVGGAIATHVLRRRRDWTAVLVIIQLVTAVTALASATFLGRSYTAGWDIAGDWQASAAAILPVSVLMGLTFPMALHVATAGVAAASPLVVARRVGGLYSLNVLGAIVGALLGGFLLIPWLGTRRSLIVLAAVYGSSALLLIFRHRRRLQLSLAALLATAAFIMLARVVPDPFSAAYARRYGRDMREFWRDEGAQTAVSVHVSEFRRSLYLDGLHQANDTPEMVTLHRIIGHLPMVLHPSPREALVVGLGGGATAGAVSQHAGTRVRIVELSDGVRKAAAFFAHINYDVLNRPNVRLRVDDGRNFLLLSGERFDVITADIIQPVHAGAGNLYSREYFALVKNALHEGGIALQWIGRRPQTQYELIMRTFLDVFPHTTLWLDGSLMVGSTVPLRISSEAFAGKLASPETAAALRDVGLTSFETLTRWYDAGSEALRRFVGSGPLLSDDRPLVEYHRSLPAEPGTLDTSSLKGDVRDILR